MSRQTPRRVTAWIRGRCTKSLRDQAAIQRHGGQAVAKGRVGQQGVTQPAGGSIQRFEALDDRTSIGAGQRAPRADARALNHTGDDTGQVLAGGTEIADRVPDGVSRLVDGGMETWVMNGPPILVASGQEYLPAAKVLPQGDGGA